MGTKSPIRGRKPAGAACRRCRGSGKEPDWRVVGAWMRARRKARGLTLRDLAKRVGVSPAYLSDLERGARAWQGEKARSVASALTARVYSNGVVDARSQDGKSRR